MELKICSNRWLLLSCLIWRCPMQFFFVQIFFYSFLSSGRHLWFLLTIQPVWFVSMVEDWWPWDGDDSWRLSSVPFFNIKILPWHLGLPLLEYEMSDELYRTKELASLLPVPIEVIESFCSALFGVWISIVIYFLIYVVTYMYYKWNKWKCIIKCVIIN